MKKYMPFNGLRWSRDSGSALYDIPQTAVFGRAGGGRRSPNYLEEIKIPRNGDKKGSPFI